MVGYSPWGRKESDTTERASLKLIWISGFYLGKHVGKVLSFLKRWCGEPGGFPSGPAVKNPPAMQDPQETRNPAFNPYVRKIPWRRACSPLQYSCLKNPWTEEPGGLQSIGLQRVRYDWSDLVRTHAHGELEWEKAMGSNRFRFTLCMCELTGHDFRPAA